MKENCTILWAEDDQDDVSLIAEAAETLKVGHLIDFVGNGKEAIEKLLRSALNKTLPQLIVLDNNMPIQSGYETLLEIYPNPAINHIPVAFFTTGEFGLEMEFIRKHAKVFRKPSSYSAFLGTLQEIMLLCKTESNPVSSSK